MDSEYLSNPIIFLIDTVFSLYILALMLRFLFQWVGAEFYNPISQFLVKITHPPLKIFRRFIPALGKIDTAALVLMISLQIIADALIFLLKGLSFTAGALIILAFTQMLSLLINIFIFSILARVVLSWINPGNYNAATSLLYSLTEPMLRTVRRIVPPFSGIDLSPLLVLIGLQIAKMMVLPPLHQAIALLS